MARLRDDVEEAVRWAEGMERAHECMAGSSGVPVRGDGRWTISGDC